MVVMDAPHGDSAAPAADELFTGGVDLQSFFDHAALEVKADGGSVKEQEEEEEEELEWLSNKDAFPAVETMALAAGARPRTNGRRRAAASSATGRRCRHCGAERTPMWREGPEGRGTLCNACGVRYRTGLLLPEYRPLSSPTFCPELHSNRHRRVVEMRRCEGKASDGGEKGGQELVGTKAYLGARPRTRGLRRPRRVVEWSLPPPLRTPASGGSAGRIHLWRTTTAQRLAASAAAPIAGVAPQDEVGLGVSSTGGLVRRPPVDPALAPAPAVGQRRCGTEGTPPAQAAPGQRLCWNCGAEQTPPSSAAKPATGQRQCQPSGTETTPQASAAKPAAASGQLRCRPRRTKKTPQAPAAKPAASLGQLQCEPREMKTTPQAPAAKAAASAGQCQHCGTEETPQWRQGPEGPRTLCNACGVQYRAGQLVPEYRPLNTFSPQLNSNIRRCFAEMRRRREELLPTATSE